MGELFIGKPRVAATTRCRTLAAKPCAKVLPL
jgi:hypothetical protein